MMFIEHLSYSLGFEFEFMEVTKDEMLEASAKSFDLDYFMLKKSWVDVKQRLRMIKKVCSKSCLEEEITWKMKEKQVQIIDENI